jgi:hypothetical protein
MTDEKPSSGKISKKTIDIIFSAAKNAIPIKCEELLFDDFGVSGRAHETNIMVIRPMPDVFEFTALGIGRVSDLYSRMKLVIDEPDLTGQFEEFRDGEVGKLIFKTKRTKIEFRCKSPRMIKTRKVFKDEMIMTFDLNAEAIRFMTVGTTAMKNKSVVFRFSAGKMYIRLIDSEGDVLDHLITTDVDAVEDIADDEVTFSYALPRLAPLLNAHRENTTVNISKRGVMNLSSDDFNIYLVPDL